MTEFNGAVLALLLVAAGVAVWRVLSRRAAARRQCQAQTAARSAAEAARLRVEWQIAEEQQRDAEGAEQRRKRERQLERARVERKARNQHEVEERARQMLARQERLLQARATIKERYARERQEAETWRKAMRQEYLTRHAAALRAGRRTWPERKAVRKSAYELQQQSAGARRQQRTVEARAALASIRDAWATLENWSEYIGQSDLEYWSQVHADALQPDLRLRWALPAVGGQELKHRSEALAQIQEIVQSLNAQFMERRLAEERARFDTIERYPLAVQQRRAVITNEDANLVVAGAGTGKTSTVIARVDYLVRRGLARPEQILVVAYNKSAAEELRERLDRIGVPPGVSTSTFHALGNAIIGQVVGSRPRLSPMVEDIQERLSLFRSVMVEMLADDVGRANLVAFMAEHLDETFAGDGRSSADERIRAERARGLRCLTGKLLRSREEVQLANWLTLSGIPWVHEEPYKVATATPWKRAYLPDFYLPDHDIYVEHFGIDRMGRTAPHINAKRYNEAICWKRSLHRDNGTTLVETYSWMREEGVLTHELERLLGAHGVRPHRLTDEEITAIVEEANLTFSDFLGLIDTFRALFQGQGASWNTVLSHARTARDAAFLAIFQPVYEAYRRRLDETDTIDFDDMINVAREHVQAGRYTNHSTHIIVDEFQDISATRLGLITDLRAQAPRARLFAVGDDWQSIYRFAGSDVGIMTNLASSVGPLARVDLDLAYRYPQELVELSSRFVRKNPSQLQKNLQSASGSGGGPPVTILYQEAIAGEGATTALDIACEGIIGQCVGLPATVLILGRYNSDRSDNVRRCITRLRAAQITARFLTVHKAKGQEADFVILPDLRRGTKGFPSEVADDLVLRMVLSPGEEFPHAEERRLFYVALTRARRHVFLIAPERDPSEFIVDDLGRDELRGYVRELGTARSKPTCPRCRGRTIIQKGKDGSPFWACEHFPVCHGRLDRCPACGDGVMELTETASDQEAFACTTCQFTRPSCPRCGEGFLEERNGRYGPFLGCSMFARGGCEYTCDGHDVTMCPPAGKHVAQGAIYAMPPWPAADPGQALSNV